MNRFLSNEYNILTARIFLGMLLMIASSDKIGDPGLFARAIEDYRIVSGTSAMALATVLPWIELLCGLFLVAGILVPASSLVAGSLLGVFTLAVLSALLRGLDISCGCLSQDPVLSQITWLKIGENVILIAVAFYLYHAKNPRFSLEQYIRGQIPGS
jgi:uncharacterized membrane protein YphA (DoxX/SURF4 family)